MKLKRTSAPAIEPIELSEAKGHLRVTTTGEDTVIAFELTEARAYCEKQMHVQMITCAFNGYLDYFPDEDYIEFPIYPMTGVVKVEYFAVDGTDYTEWASTNYVFDEFRKPPRLVLASGCSWPDTEDRPNAVKITFNAGFNTAADVPDTWIRTLKMVLLHMHEHRGDEGLVTLPRLIDDMIYSDTNYLV